MTAEAEKPKTRQKKVNWGVIRTQYETGRFSVTALAIGNKVSDRMIRKKINAEGWAIGETANLIARQSREQAALQGPAADRAVAIEASIIQNVAIIRDHQGVVGKGRALTLRLLDELGEQMDNLAELHELVELAVEAKDDARQASRLEADLTRRLSIGDRANTMAKLSTAAKNWIELERQAFNLDGDKGEDDPEKWTDERLNARLSYLLGKARAAEAAGSEDDEGEPA